jgi:hypothetical protein
MLPPRRPLVAVIRLQQLPRVPVKRGVVCLFAVLENAQSSRNCTSRSNINDNKRNSDATASNNNNRKSSSNSYNSKQHPRTYARVNARTASVEAADSRIHATPSASHAASWTRPSGEPLSVVMARVGITLSPDTLLLRGPDRVAGADCKTWPPPWDATCPAVAPCASAACGAATLSGDVTSLLSNGTSD